MPDRFFVTGAHGFIGRRLVQVLADGGAEVVRASMRREPDLPGEEALVDLRDAARAAQVMAGCSTVIHLAGRSGGIQLQEAAQEELFTENQAITVGVLRAAAATGVRRVFLGSSGVVYANLPGSTRPIPESDPLVSPSDHPTAYAWSKVCDEVLGGWYQRDGVFEVVVGRFTNVYGPGASIDPIRATVIHDLVRKALLAGPDGKMEVWGDGLAVRSFLYVDDAARAVTLIATDGKPGEAYNIDDGSAIRVGQLATLIRDAVDPSIVLTFDSARPGGAPYRVMDGSKLAGLGFVPETGIEEGIRATVEAFRPLV